MNTMLTEKNLVNERDDTLDIMKGLCILFVVIGHTYTPVISNFVYLFHVAVFFMISGYCFNNKYLDSWKGGFNLLKKRLVSLWIPYVAWNLLFLLLQNFFLKIGLITNDKHYFDLNPLTNYGFVNFLPIRAFPKTILKSFFFMNCRPFVGGLWFLGGLFFVTFTYSCIEVFLKKLKIEKFHIIISVILLCLGYFIDLKDLFSNFGITKQLIIIFETEILFCIGNNIKNCKLIRDIPTLWVIIVLGVCFLFLGILMSFGRISIASNIITNPIYYIIVSVLGWYFVWSLSKLISLCNLKKFFLFCGNKTIPILVLHKLAFKLVTLIQYFVSTEKDFVVLALFPVFKNNLLWSFLYVLVGVGIPLLFSLIFGRFNISKKIFRF